MGARIVTMMKEPSSGLANMSDEELSRWISEKIFDEDPLRCKRCGWPLKDNPEDGCVDGNCSQRPLPEKRIPDMVNDPAMTVMLLELPGFVDVCFLDEDKVYDVTFCGEEEHSVDCGAKMETAKHAKLGRAVAEAFALAKGWEG